LRAALSPFRPIFAISAVPAPRLSILLLAAVMFGRPRTTVTSIKRGRYLPGETGMDTAMTLNWLEARRVSNTRTRQDEQARLLTLARENARLAEENHRLHQQFEDLAASTDIWIRLYEAALQRANGTQAMSAISTATVN